MELQGDFVHLATNQLFASSFSHVLVRWLSSDKVEIIESKGFDNWQVGVQIETKILCDSNDRKKLSEHYKEISDTLSHLHFSGKEEKGQNFYATSQQINGEKVSLWMLLPQEKKSMQYLQNAVHDMKAPINSIIGAVNLMQHMIGGEIDVDELKIYVDMVKMSANNAVTIVNEVMELAEIESNDYVLETKETSLKTFIQTYINTHRLLTLKKKISIQFHCDIEIMVHLNAVKMTRVLDNVISNAVKFSPPGSTIYFSIEASQSSHATIQIRDEGIGMPPVILEQLFVKFGNAKRKGLDGENSSGLGMSIVKQIMELHGGDVRVESEEGKGTSVFLDVKKLVK